MVKTQFKETAEQRGIPFAEKGMDIEVDGKRGIIKDFNPRMNLDVLFAGEKETTSCHPKRETVYFDKNSNVIADFRNTAEFREISEFKEIGA